jgi:hypothetical protein
VAAPYAARFSVRALESTVDAGVLWLGRRWMAAVLLVFVPRLPSSDRPGGPGLAGGSARMSTGTSRRLRIFAPTRSRIPIVLLAGAGMLVGPHCHGANGARGTTMTNDNDHGLALFRNRSPLMTSPALGSPVAT